MTLDEMVRSYAENNDCTHAAAREAIKSVGGLIFAGLRVGHEMPLPDVGTFSVRRAKARVGRNVHTGERVEIPAGPKVVFRPASALRRAVNG